jgi:hypothetical protein
MIHVGFWWQDLCVYLHFSIYTSRLTPLSSAQTRRWQEPSNIIAFWFWGEYFSSILCNICSRQELWSQQRQPLPGNGSINTPVARQQLHNTQQWSNWEVAFSMWSVLRLDMESNVCWVGKEDELRKKIVESSGIVTHTVAVSNSAKPGLDWI